MGNPIGSEFGFWMLIVSSIIQGINQQPTAAAVYLSAALIFNAIKTIND